MSNRWQRSIAFMTQMSLSKLCTVVFVFIFLFFSFQVVDVTNRIFPEVGMVLNSQCNTAAPGWNGKILGYQVWDNPAMWARNDSFSSYDYSSFRRLSASPPAENEIIIIASHHKTGTILSQKIFARVCGIMKWCCVFHVTKDSLVAVKHSLLNEPVKLMGHTQWAWNPNELGSPYRFVHFYRDPYKKIASGYRYHMDGVEAWCKKPLFYQQACNPPPPNKTVTKKDVFHFCQSVHLCEPCCRMEHEARYAQPHNKKLAHGSRGEQAFAARPAAEYHFICKHLSGVNVSLMDALEKSESFDQAVRIEASIDFYENLRMARIINNTWNDPRSLNIDLDDFMNNYEDSVRSILHHLNLKLTAHEIEDIVADLQFYDIDNSPIYRYSQSNPLMNHINQEAAAEKQAVKDVLAQDTAIRSFYQPIFDLMNTAIHNVGTSVGARNAREKSQTARSLLASPQQHLRLIGLDE